MAVRLTPSGFQTVRDESPLPATASVAKKTPKQKCEEKGGRWDEQTQTCVLVDKPKKEELPPKVKLPTPETFIDPKTGRPSGLALPSGKTYLGLKPQEVEKLAAQQQGLAAMPEGTAPVGTARKEFEEQEAIRLERERLIEGEIPQRRELDPLAGLGEKVPVIGGFMGVTRRLIHNPLFKALGIESERLEDLQLAPEEMKTFALSEIERQEIEKGLTANEKFGELIESIPVVGSLASKWAGGLVETPSENAKEAKSNILKEKRRIANIETNVKMGYLPVSVAREQITDIEENVQRLESRIRLLINHSPELRFNSDYVNTVETEILLTREKAFQAKQNILTGATQDPTELQYLQKLQNLAGDSGEELL